MTPASPERNALLRIVVVDDSRDAVASLVMLLSLTGYETAAAHDDDEAVRVAESYRPQVVLRDIGLPRLNGYGVARQIRSRPWGRNPVLIALTGWGQPPDGRTLADSDFDHPLVKPVYLGPLIKLLASLAETQQRAAGAAPCTAPAR